MERYIRLDYFNNLGEKSASMFGFEHTLKSKLPMKNMVILALLQILLAIDSVAQNVGIGTTSPNPTAVLHVDAGASLTNGLLVTGNYDWEATIPSLNGGSRLMFYPGKGAFRAGYVESNIWNNNSVGFFSMGLGYNTLANGNYSTASGFNTTASGTYATAMGFYTIASGEYSTAQGVNSTASGLYSTALGSTSTASGISSFALGGGTASGNNSIALGSGRPSAFGSITIGAGRARGENSIAMGLFTMAKAYGSVTIGNYNDTTDMPDPTSFMSTDRIFQIGNGSSNVRDNAITVLRNGNTGMGVLIPAYRLDLDSRMRIRSGGSGSSSAGIWLNKNDNSGLLGFVGVDANNDIGIYNNNSSGWSFLIDNATGNAWLKGTLTQNSDARLKKNIEPINNALSQLSQLNGYHYNWKEESRDPSLQTGLLAQEVEKVMPELVRTDDKGMKSVNYMGLIPYLLEAMKMQQATITTQQQQMDELKKMVADYFKK